MIKFKMLAAKILAFFMKLFNIKFPTLADQIEKFIRVEMVEGGKDFAPEVFPMKNNGRDGWAITVVFTNNLGQKKCMTHLFLPSIEHVNEIKMMILDKIKKLS